MSFVAAARSASSRSAPTLPRVGSAPRKSGVMPAEEPSIAAHASELVLEFLASRGLASDEVRAALEREASSGANSSGATSESKNSADAEEAAPAPAGKRDPSLLEGLIRGRAARSRRRRRRPPGRRRRCSQRVPRAPAASGAPQRGTTRRPTRSRTSGRTTTPRLPPRAVVRGPLAAFVGSHRRAAAPGAERDAIFERYEQMRRQRRRDGRARGRRGRRRLRVRADEGPPGRAFGADAPTPAPPVRSRSPPTPCLPPTRRPRAVTRWRR